MIISSIFESNSNILLGGNNNLSLKFRNILENTNFLNDKLFSIQIKNENEFNDDINNY